MIGAAATVFAASLVGSPHCAGMCGGIAAFCGGVGECWAKRSMLASATYHAARLAGYVAVGGLAGAFGTLLNAGGTLVGVQRVAAVVAGATVALVGIGLLAKAAGVESARAPLPAWVKRALSAVHRAAGALPPVRRALVIGLATPLLPCGWLWAFAAVAAGTGSVVGGAVVMAAFWAGTVPVLALVGAGIAGLGAERRRLLGALAGTAMIAVGVYTAGVRAPLAETVAERLAVRADEPQAVVHPACCESEAP
ncbi:MAG: sulfite exporter TauE/SafE family protein [Phycisphaerae bacterium]|nr:sulfite exporter TauE/SafE family protein [Phycisphaerae bacterium]